MIVTFVTAQTNTTSETITAVKLHLWLHAKLCIFNFAFLTFLRLPPMHRHIDQLSDRIVHAHFGKAAVARFRIRFALRARTTCAVLRVSSMFSTWKPK